MAGHPDGRHHWENDWFYSQGLYKLPSRGEAQEVREPHLAVRATQPKRSQALAWAQPRGNWAGGLGTAVEVRAPSPSRVTPILILGMRQWQIIFPWCGKKKKGKN